MKNDKLVVIKYGSSSVTNSRGMDQQRLQNYVTRLLRLREQYDIILVSSGSITTGISVWGAHKHAEMGDAQTLATIGSAAAFTAWQTAFENEAVLSGQLLVTHREIDERHEGGMLRRVLRKNLEHNVISIINENDALSDVELAKLSYGGDNDGLAAHIAVAMEAGHLLLLTDVEGLLDRQGQLIPMVDAKNLGAANKMIGLESSHGRGGMQSKLAAASLANQAGIRVHIAHADTDLTQVMSDKSGTTVAVGKN